MNFNRGQGCSWVICCECERTFLVADACDLGHPDDPPSVLCERCSAAYSQVEMEANGAVRVLTVLGWLSRCFF